MCGIVGIFAKDSNSYSPKNISSRSIEYIGNLEHRGKDCCGLVSAQLEHKDLAFYRIRSNSPPHVAFHTSNVDSYRDHNRSLYNSLKKLSGPMILGHTRFTTSGEAEGINNCQPIIYSLEENTLEALNDTQNKKLIYSDFLSNGEKNRIALSHNGEVNKKALDILIEKAGYENKSHSVLSDTSSLAAYVLMESVERGSVEEALKSVFKNVRGAWSLLGVISLNGEVKAFATRDKYATHPLEIAEDNEAVICASENAAFRRAGINKYRSVSPGDAEILCYDDDGLLQQETIHIANADPRKCAFELVYYEPPDAREPFRIRLFDPDYVDVVLGKKTLEEYREEKRKYAENFGIEEDLAEKISMFDVSTIRERIGQLYYLAFGGRKGSHTVHCGIPKSGVSYGLGDSRASGEPVEEAIFINPTHSRDRSFQQPNDEMRKETIQKKLLYKPITECLDADELYHILVHGDGDREYTIELDDDSSVTGNVGDTVVKVLKLLPEQGGSGAKRVDLRFISPPIVKGCDIGINHKPDKLLVKALGKKYGIKDPAEWPVKDLHDFELKAKEEFGADSVKFGTIPFMEAVFGEGYGYSCIGAKSMPCAPSG